MAHLRSISVALTFVLAVCTVKARTASPQALDVNAALEDYTSGHYATFLERITRNGAIDKDFFSTFEKATDRWLKEAGEPPAWRRTLVAASVAVEIAHLMRGEPADRAARYFVWATRLMRQAAPSTPTEAERLWYLAAMAGMQESDEPWVLTMDKASGSSLLDPIRRKLGGEGLVSGALKRFPNEPRFLLAQVKLLDSLANDADWVPVLVDYTKAQASGRAPEAPRSGRQAQTFALRISAKEALARYAEIPAIVEAYEALEIHRSLRAEVALHLGYLEGARFNWSTAFDHLRRVPTLTHEPFLLYLGEYFSGRIFQTLGDHRAAVDAFEKALVVLPQARSASTHLAAELMLSDRAGDRERAYALLREAYTDGAPADPWRLYWNGDAWLWPIHIGQLREALR